MSNKKRICLIGAGPSGMSALYHLAANGARPGTGSDIEVVCYEKQGQILGLWNYSWHTGTDEFGEPCHNGMYRDLWINAPKECHEFPDYTWEQHLGRPTPAYPPRTAMRDYLEGRFNKSKVPLTDFIKFHTVVRSVKYLDETDEFHVTSTNLQTSRISTDIFSHVITATGIFNAPNKPSYEGIAKFPGRILHSHDFRNAGEFKGQRILAIGGSYSAEDMALQCLKFGAQSVICTWRTKPMGFKWPKGVEERPLLQRVDGNTVTFKDGSTAQVDAIILCTGYIYAFPFMENRLRLQSKLSLYPDGLYKGTLWLGGGNRKVFYLGVQNQYYSFTMFDVQALWACRYIIETLPGEPKPMNEMVDNIKAWVSRCEKLTDCHVDIDFQSDFVRSLSESTGYDQKATMARQLFHTWEDHKQEDIATYRDHCFRSLYTGKESAKHATPWMKSFDDSIEAFVGK